MGSELWGNRHVRAGSHIQGYACLWCGWFPRDSQHWGSTIAPSSLGKGAETTWVVLRWD